MAYQHNPARVCNSGSVEAYNIESERREHAALSTGIIIPENDRFVRITDADFRAFRNQYGCPMAERDVEALLSAGHDPIDVCMTAHGDRTYYLAHMSQLWKERVEMGTIPANQIPDLSITQHELIALQNQFCDPGDKGYGGDKPAPAEQLSFAPFARVGTLLPPAVGGAPAEFAGQGEVPSDLSSELAEAKGMARTFRLLAVGAGIAAGLSVLVAASTYYMSKKKKRGKGKRR